MKKIIIASALLLFGISTFAQSTSKDFPAKIKELENTTSATNYWQLTQDFVGISKSEKQNWLAQYYTALSFLKLGNEEVLSGKILDAQKSANYATPYIDAASKLATDHESQSEIFLLKYMRDFILAAGTNYEMGSMNQNFENLRQATTLNPNNPRILLVKGETTYFLPQNLGGSKEKGKVILNEALSNFDTYTAKANQPNWGKAEITRILNEK